MIEYGLMTRTLVFSEDLKDPSKSELKALTNEEGCEIRMPIADRFFYN